MVDLPDGEKKFENYVYLFRHNIRTRRTDRQTPHDGIGRAVSRGKNRPPMKRSRARATFLRFSIVILVKSFCAKFGKFVGNSYPHTCRPMSTNFCRFILIFHQIALFFPRVPIVFTLSSFVYSPIK